MACFVLVPLFVFMLLVASGAGFGHASDAPPQGQGLMECLNDTQGCGRFAALLAASANASDFFNQRIDAGSALTVFCPNDHAVADFEPAFKNLSADDQLAVVLLHGAAVRYGREQMAAFELVEVRTLAADAAAGKSHVLTVHDDGETVWLWPSPPTSRGSGGVARVTMEVPSCDSPDAVAVYVVDAVLLPDRLRQLRDEAASCWLCTILFWVGLCMVLMGILGQGILSLYLYLYGLRWQDAMNQCNASVFANMAVLSYAALWLLGVWD